MIRANPVHRVHSLAQRSHVLSIRRLDVPQVSLPTDHLLSLVNRAYPIAELQIVRPLRAQEEVRYLLVCMPQWGADGRPPELPAHLFGPQGCMNA